VFFHTNRDPVQRSEFFPGELRPLGARSLRQRKVVVDRGEALQPAVVLLDLREHVPNYFNGREITCGNELSQAPG
jgi:hypothetical protein